MKFQFFIRTIVFLLLVLVSPVWTQDPTAANKLRLAQSFEENGEWERAVQLYEELFRADSQNIVFSDGLRRAYVQLKAYDKAIALVLRQITARPTDVALRTSLGGLYYDAGDEARSDSAWSVVLAGDKKNVGLYRYVASQMMERRLYDRTILLYRRARTETGNDGLFSDEMGMLYSYMQQYDAATREFVKSLRASPEQLGAVQSRIGAFTIRGAGLKAATDVTTEELLRSPENISLHALRAWLAMESKDFERALLEYETMDHLKNANGAEIFNFAQRAQQEKAYAAAAQAYRKVAYEFKNPALLAQSKYGYALAIDHLSDTDAATDSSLQSDPQAVSEAHPTLRGALALYQQVINDFPNTVVSAGAYFRIGLIQSERMYDVDRAIEAFDKARKIVRGNDLTFQATFHISDLYVENNRLADARRELAPIAAGDNVTYSDQALVRLAELDYFEQGFDSALVKLNRVSRNLATEIANDALQLSYFILENKTSAPAALAGYSKAHLRSRQRKFSEALTSFQDIVRSYPKALLVDDALMEIAGLDIRLQRYADAGATYRFIADSLNTSILKDKAQFHFAELYERFLNDKQKSIDAYQALLSRFPNSLYAEESRKRIRQLRGDPL